MKLYELTEEFRRLEDMAESVASEDDALAFSQLWEEIAGAFEEKAERTACVIKNLVAESDAIKAEESRLSARRKALEGSAERLKDYLESHMKSTGIDKINGKLFTLAIQNNPPALRVDETLLPDGYFEVVLEPNKGKIKEALKAGEVIPGACLVQGSSLRIR